MHDVCDQIVFTKHYEITVMQLVRLLHNLFKKELPFVHKTRLQNLLDACKTAIQSNKLYLTGLGRELSNKNKTCSNIQKIDRLLGNLHLQKEQNDFYKVMFSYLIQDNSTPWLHVDWTCISAVTNLYVLRASLSMTGRSIVIYEECHPKKKENNHATHKAFLNQLKKLLPPSVQPIIVTDAGFRGPWFQHILDLGWNFVGRLRNKNLVLLDGSSAWELSHTFFAKATAKPSYLGHGVLTKEGKVPAHFVAYRGKNKKRHKINNNKKPSRSGKSKLYSKSNTEPWILVSSLPLTTKNANLAVNIYRQRMRIEENIRDTKCPHYGLGLKSSRSKSSARLGILLLIAAIATFAAWLAGIETKRRGQATDFQAHSAKFKSSLSIVFLGRQALKKGFKISEIQLFRALKMLLQINKETQLEAPI